MKKTGVLIFSVMFLFCVSFVSANILNVPGDYPTIQDAIDNATSGDTINVAPSIYNEDLVINNKQNIILEGNGASILPSAIGFIIADSDGITIKNFEINTTGTNSHGIWIGGEPNGYSNSDNINIENNIINIDGQSSGIYAEQTSPRHENWKIIGNSINAPNQGVNIELYDVYDVLIDNNILGISGSVSLVYSSENSNTGKAIISNNIFNGNGNIAGVTPTIWLESDFQSGDGNTKVNDINITRNKFYNWINYGIRIGEGNPNFGDVSDVVINYNNFYSGTGPGISNEIENEIIDGTYNWWNSCDGPGPVGPGSGAGVSANVTYTPWLGICINNKTEVTCAFESKNISVSANLTGAEILDAWVSYTINGINKNKTYTSKSGNTYYFTIPSSDLTGNGGMNVSWNVYATDSINEYNNSWKEFYVRASTYLGVIPWPADGLNNWFVTEPLFSLIKDTIGGNIYYQWDSDDVFLYTAPFNLTNIPNPPPHSAGILDLNWWTDFGICGNETAQTELFYVDLTDPIITNLQPANGSTTYNTKPIISTYIDEFWQSNSGINKSSVTMSLNGNPVSANVSVADTLDAIAEFNPNVDLVPGIHNVSVYAEDNAGRTNSLTWIFEVLAPFDFNLTVYSPENMIYETKRVPFNITTSLEVSKIEYINYADTNPSFRRLCRNCNEYGNSRERLKSLKEGENNITIRATYDGGLTKEENILAIVDTNAPKISKTLPANNDFTNGSLFSVKYTEENLQSVTLYYNSSESLVCNSGKNQECTTSADLTSHDGEEIEYYFEVTDILNNSAQSKKTLIKVDTTSPIIEDLNYSISKSRIILTLNITEQNLDKVQYKDLNQKNPRFRTLCTKLEQGICEKRISFSGDAPNITIQVLDKAGNSAEQIINL
ncbi:hypothetical protein J4404_03335 [Candidatus Woesearchaeota archaeon]|nr:hypothetical protein [Candidatus Woesearchaeota archaeon]